MTLLPSTLAHARSICATENSQPVHCHQNYPVHSILHSLLGKWPYAIEPTASKLVTSQGITIYDSKTAKIMPSVPTPAGVLSERASASQLLRQASPRRNAAPGLQPRTLLRKHSAVCIILSRACPTSRGSDATGGLMSSKRCPQPHLCD